MTPSLNRRDFLQHSAGTALALGAVAAAAPVTATAATSASSLSSAAPAEAPSSAAETENTEIAPGRFRKAVIYEMTPKTLSVEERFVVARDAGFEGVEVSPVTDPAEAERMRKAADKAGLPIHSIIYGGWQAPLSHPDAATRDKGVAETEAALRCAQTLGADAVLLVPGIVNAQTGYRDAYERSQAGIRRLIPLAEQLKVKILVENVWNNFLLSPIEFGAYVDAFQSPWVQAYFDVGNVVAYAWPEDWIRTLDKRIGKVHLKDYKTTNGRPGLGGNGQWVNLREGSIDWPAVRRALIAVGYEGFLTVELPGGDADYLRDVAGRVDKILADAPKEAAPA